MIAWANGGSVRLIESDYEFTEVLRQAERTAQVRHQLSVTRSWLVVVALALLATWMGLAYVWAVNRLT